MSLAFAESLFPPLSFGKVTHTSPSTSHDTVISAQNAEISPSPEEILNTYTALLRDKEFVRSWQPSLAHTFFQGIRSQLDTWYYRLRKSRRSAQFEQWNAHTYIELLTNPTYRNPELLSSLFTQNFDAFSAEYTRGQLIWTAEYIFGERGEILGLADSYQDNLASDRQGNFSTLLYEQQKNTQRAQLEDENLAALQQWILQSPLHGLFVWSSPPGKVREGYGGEASHSFTFLYHKIDHRRARVYQFRSWMPLEQHAALQAALGTQPKKEDLEATHALIKNVLTLTPPTEAPELWAQSMISTIQATLYSHTNPWRVKPEAMPVVDETDFTQMRDFLCALYIQQVVPLLLRVVPEVSSAEDPVWQAFIASPPYQALVKQLDTAFAVLAYQPLAKFVEETAENQPAVPWTNRFKKLLRKRSNPEEKLTALSQAEVSHRLVRLYSILQSEKISQQDREWFNAMAPNLIGITNRAFSMGQCGLGTFLNPQLLQSMSVGEQLSLLNSIQLNQLSAPQLAQLVGTERFKLWKPNQTCISCGADGVWVGECGVCYKCEYADSQGKLGQTELDPTQLDQFEELTATDQTTLKTLFNKLKLTLFVRSVSFEQFLHNDIIDRSKLLPPVLQQLRHELTIQANPLTALVLYLFEVVANKETAIIAQLQESLELNPT